MTPVLRTWERFRHAYHWRDKLMLASAVYFEGEVVKSRYERPTCKYEMDELHQEFIDDYRQMQDTFFDDNEAPKKITLDGLMQGRPWHRGRAER